MSSAALGEVLWALPVAKTVKLERKMFELNLHFMREKVFEKSVAAGVKS